MASTPVLKRKRGATQGKEEGKRAKPVLEKQADLDAKAPTSKFDEAFAAAEQKNEGQLVVADSQASNSQTTPKKKSKKDKSKKHEKKTDEDKISEWKTSAPLGGRMIDVDPVFTEDEKYAIWYCSSIALADQILDSLL
jgi:NET1-associated nuclear protein 1 (U3 small nucleolar RNA-associated protein 17)